jgi:hypothetical protein
MTKRWTHSVCLGLALAAAALVGLDARGGTAMPDAWITTKVKIALLTTENVSALDVNVDTVDGRVTLHGSVGSAAEKARAEDVARGGHPRRAQPI